jgi:ABC-2 type transport system permease protein
VNVLRAELLKATTTRLLLWFGVGVLAFIALVVSTHIGTGSPDELATASNQRSLLEAAGLTAVITTLVGSVLMTTEYAHGTINQSYLAVPARERLLLTKLVAAVLVAAALAVLAALATLLIGELWYAGRGITLHLGGGTWTPLLSVIGASMLAAAIGVGVGAILRRQTGSIVVILLWLLIGENIIALIHGGARYGPGHVVAAVVAAHGHSTPDTLALWPAVVLSLVYAAALCGVGFVLAARSDVASSGD